MTLPFIGQKPVDNPLTQIAANIRQIANPNWEMQLEMQRRMMADPSLVGQLAEVERNAPGTIAKMGFGKKLTEIIQKTPETLAQKQTKELRDLQLQDARNSLEQFTMKKTEFEQQQVEREKALKGIEVFKKFDIPKETERFVAGKPSKEFLTALATAGNENQQIFGMHVSNLSQMRRLEQEHMLAMERIRKQEGLAASREDKSYQRMINQNAVDSYQKEKVGSVSAWKAILDDEKGGNERLQMLMQNPLAAKTQLDRDLLAIGNKLQSDQRSALDFKKNQLQVKARQSFGAAQAKGLKPSEVAFHINDVNNFYSAIREIDPSFNVSVRQKGKDIQLVDENTGLTINDETQAIDPIKLGLPTKRGMTHRQVLDEALRTYRDTPALLTTGTTKHEFMGQFKRKYGPDMYKLLVKRIQDE